MKSSGKHRRLAGVVAVAGLAPACMASTQASRPAARDLACTTVHSGSAPGAGTGSQRAGVDLPPVPGGLFDVAARSPRSAAAVGFAGPMFHSRALVALWNGAAWRTLNTRALPPDSALNGVAWFPGGAWAVGQKDFTQGGRVFFPLVVQVTGTTVRQVPIPRTGYGSTLERVAATSATDAWAVGTQNQGNLVLHWNGTAWTRVVLRGVGEVTGVAATSRTNAWAAAPALARRIIHWNGRRWAEVVTPDIGMRYDLQGVAATSARDVWAAGSTVSSSLSSRVVILHWNGRRWACALSPKMPFTQLMAVSASSAGNAWAVGGSGSAALALHWNGHVWKQVMIARPGQVNFLHGVAVIPQSGGGWAVGSTDSTTLMLHWNGTAWQ